MTSDAPESLIKTVQGCLFPLKYSRRHSYDNCESRMQVAYKSFIYKFLCLDSFIQGSVDPFKIKKLKYFLVTT